MSYTGKLMASRMTGLGQKRKSSAGLGMSALGGEADVISAKADIAALGTADAME